ncbi:hypothetical protein EJ05DRAFT_45198 [Pseudovirgaria hyperparasitica]|uniref:Integral membrane protein n=1 Tax=Pseudovirgaria hyperparasitica TaxID=470096 RepID=A0A6A6W5J9_9PEZI|nr:uncharacterized protein EJ05DRAFT_45198 [Pseudovirgaria hyperparasitica]KAF2756837.1 hypothetical protein EJ05DRAFT_45198 [Pseudovirgaria hyperparasitica]
MVQSAGIKEFKEDPTFTTWGPFISPEYVLEPITLSDVIIATVVFALTILNVGIAIYIGIAQSKSARRPLRSVYIWLIWLELLVSFLMASECYMHLLKIIRPSFAFYFTILFWWCIQVQLLLQIIINRIRVITPNRKKSLWILVTTAVVVTLVNISVFNIWIPARLQTSSRYIHINEIWDRIEKGIYLAIDASLNWYFIRAVKKSLVDNGLQKYHKLLRFNQRIIIISLLMDVMIIAAMSIPNSFVYIQFHPLAYLVKLNIEMTMADLIKRIAISSDAKGRFSHAQEFAAAGTTSSSRDGRHRSSFRGTELDDMGKGDAMWTWKENRLSSDSFVPVGTQMKKTTEITIVSEPRVNFGENDEERPTHARPNGVFNMHRPIGIRTTDRSPAETLSRQDSVGSDRHVRVPGRNRSDSRSDEIKLVD